MSGAVNGAIGFVLLAMSGTDATEMIDIRAGYRRGRSNCVGRRRAIALNRIAYPMQAREHWARKSGCHAAEPA